MKTKPEYYKLTSYVGGFALKDVRIEVEDFEKFLAIIKKFVV